MSLIANIIREMVENLRLAAQNHSKGKLIKYIERIYLYLNCRKISIYLSVRSTIPIWSTTINRKVNLHVQLVKNLFAYPSKDTLFHYLLFHQRS